MSETPFMPKATAVWLVENTTLTFRQIANFCNLHELEVKGIADGDVAKGIKAYNPILAGQLSREEIESCSKNPDQALNLSKRSEDVQVKERKKPKYTPLSKRQDRPDAILWLCKNAPELNDGQISKLVGSTKGTVSLIRKRSYWNFSSLKPRDPVILALCTQEVYQKAVDKAKRRVEREKKAKLKEKKNLEKQMEENKKEENKKDE
ncbi:MAG: cytoplasmic protein [Pelagibacterales bacterium MED-G40]|nr:MAG: cytoplasmic protein [Pelagibacterales bacterium MED-G40]|tara:strand:+ start:232 stop:849 length:618 start_codon:yes stop_codon:yes gene_type:complete